MITLNIPTDPPRNASKASKATPDTTGQVKTKARPQAPGRTSLGLTFSPTEASAFRALCDSLRFPNGKKPSMALVARRSLEVYRSALGPVLRQPSGREVELRALTRLASEGAQKRLRPE